MLKTKQHREILVGTLYFGAIAIALTYLLGLTIAIGVTVGALAMITLVNLAFDWVHRGTNND